MAGSHSKYNWGARKASETAFASGSGASAFDMTKLAALVGMAYPKSYSNSMYPIQRPLKDELEAQDDDLYGGIELDSGWENIDGDREEYVQDSFYLDKIISQITAGMASTPLSYAIHWQDHILDATPANNRLRYESYGCYINELDFNIKQPTGKKDGFPTWNIKDSCYATKYATTDGTTVDSLEKVTWLTNATAPISTKASYIIGGNPVSNIEGKLNIKLTWDKTIEAGDDASKYPKLIRVDVVFTAKFRDVDQYRTLAENLLKLNADESKYTIKITTGLASCIPQITNMKVSVADLNGIPEKGLTTYDMEFKSTYNSVLTKESS